MTRVDTCIYRYIVPRSQREGHVQPEFLFDFGSPNAYLSHLIIPRIEQRTGARFKYVPILLGGVFRLTNNKSPMESFAGIKNKLEFQRVEMRRFLKRNGITAFKMNPFFPVNTLQLMRGAVAAELEGVFAPYVDAMFRFMWAEPRKMDDPDVIRASMNEAGLPADLLLRRAQDDDVKQRLLANTQAAVDRGVFGSPSFFIGDELFFGKDQLRDVEEEIGQQKQAA
ncbi:MAG: 2-hydroxychromene-2-carboxylate isomerase [Methylobacteriaceae bacterium]|nr:2-hydroxychromene-2-carboxylate isomerase [Methylobacteriaceae bacterium]